MRFAVMAAALLACSSPALATGGFECRPISGAGPILTIGFGHSIAVKPFLVMIREGKRTFTTRGPGATLAFGQIWLDNRYLWLDVTDINAERYEAKLRATFYPKLKWNPAIGSLTRNGRTHRVRCIEA